MSILTKATLIAQPSPTTITSITLLKQNISALVFGAAIIFIVGFMPIEAAHNAAHDSRHTLSFPCH